MTFTCIKYITGKRNLGVGSQDNDYPCWDCFLEESRVAFLGADYLFLIWV